MKKFIVVTNFNNDEENSVEVDNIKNFNRIDDRTVIYFCDAQAYLRCKETPREILGLIEGGGPKN